MLESVLAAIGALLAVAGISFWGWRNAERDRKAASARASSAWLAAEARARMQRAEADAAADRDALVRRLRASGEL